MGRSQILSIILFAALAFAAVLLQTKLGASGWIVVAVLIAAAMLIAFVKGWRRKPLDPIGGPPSIAVEEVRPTAALEAEMTVVAAARVRSPTDRANVLGALWLLDGGGVVVAIRDPMADERFAAGRFPAERVRWRRDAFGALVAVDGDGERRALAWDLESPGAIAVKDGEVLEGTLEDAVERATGLSVAGGRQLL
jgi:hypothetical protein